MSDPFFFGEQSRALYGILHSCRTGAPGKDSLGRACLVCPPLMQDAIRSQRALWQLSELLAQEHFDVLRFDWFGTGESMGESTDLRLAGMFTDLDTALMELSLATQPASLRILALRSAALPVLAHASASGRPANLVLWDPVLDGRALVDDWRRQQAEQLSVAGRYPFGVPDAEEGELMGYDLDEELLEALATIDQSRLGLAAGSRVLLAAWEASPAVSAFVEQQRGRGIDVECLWLEASERPTFDQPRQFETQLFPRKSVTMLGRQVSGALA